MLICQYAHLGSAGKVEAVLRRCSSEADVACADGFGEGDTLECGTALKVAFGDGVGPCLAVLRELYAVALDDAVGAAVLPWQVGEALDGLHLAAVEVDGVGVLGYGDAVGCVPDGLGFAIDEVAGVLAGFLAAASQNGDGDELHLFEGACDAHVGVLGVPDGDGAAIAHIDGLAGVELGTAFGRS